MSKSKLLIKQRFNQSGFGIIEILLIVIAIGVIISAGFYVYDGHKSPSPQTAQPAASKSVKGAPIDFFGHSIPQVDCSQVGKIVKGSSPNYESSGYVCYSGAFSVDGEKIQYVSITKTQAYQQKLRQECGLDCGSSPSPVEREAESLGGVYIIRANGSIEPLEGIGGGNVDTVLSNLTGCGNPSLGPKEQNGTLVFDKVGNSTELGVLSDLQNLEVTDTFGNTCVINLKLVAYLSSLKSSSGPDIAANFKALSVHYVLKDPSTCAVQTAPTQITACYTAQATMRNDLSFCNKTGSLVGSVYGDQCKSSLAARRRDATLCDQLAYTALSCKQNVAEASAYFTGQLTID